MPMNPPLRDWSGKRAWVIGASTGIGLALVHELLRRGAHVAVSARSRESLEAAVIATPDRAVVLPMDVTVVSSVAAAFQSLTTTWNRIDAVFLVAGAYTPMRAIAFDAAEFRRLFEVNVFGVANVLERLIPHFVQARSGHVAIVSSVAGFRGLPKALAYGPTKAALINLAECLYFDLASSGVGVHVVNPGFVRTPLTADNDFHMPALIEPAEAAEHILGGLARGDFEIHFPGRFTWWLKVLRMLPYRWYFPLVHRATGL